MVGYKYCVLHPLAHDPDVEMNLSCLGKEEKFYLLGRPKSHSLPGKVSLPPDLFVLKRRNIICLNVTFLLTWVSCLCITY